MVATTNHKLQCTRRIYLGRGRDAINKGTVGYKLENCNKNKAAGGLLLIPLESAQGHASFPPHSAARLKRFSFADRRWKIEGIPQSDGNDDDDDCALPAVFIICTFFFYFHRARVLRILSIPAANEQIARDLAPKTVLKVEEGRGAAANRKMLVVIKKKKSTRQGHAVLGGQRR